MGVTPATPNGPQDSLATVSHTGPNAKNVPDFDPKSVFTRLFMAGGDRRHHHADQATKLASVRKSVLDSVLSDGASLQKKLGAADKQRVEQHLTSIRAIEQRLVTTRRRRQDAACEVRQPTGADDRQGHQQRSAARRDHRHDRPVDAGARL